MNATDIEKTLRDTVAASLKGDKQGWPAQAAACVRQLLLSEQAKAALSADARGAVTTASRAAMNAVLLAEGDLPSSAVALLKELIDVAQQKALDPGEVMRWGMEGIAPAALLAPAGARAAVSSRIDEAFTDMGLIFDEIAMKQTTSRSG